MMILYNRPFLRLSNRWHVVGWVYVNRAGGKASKRSSTCVGENLHQEPQLHEI